MNLKLVKLQVLLCGLFGLILISEWGYGELFGSHTQLISQNSSAEPEAENIPSFPALISVNTDFNELVERPLFIEGRKPIVETPVDDSKPLESGQIDDWLLIGIFEKNKQPMALFTKKDEAKKFMKIGSQQNISGWLLKEIQSDRVILQQADQQKMVLLRKPRVATNKPPVPGKSGAHPQSPRPGKPIPPPTNINPENVNDESQ